MAMGGNLITSGRKSFNWLNFTTAILLSLGSLVHGYFTGIIATTLTKASFSTYMLLADANGNPTHNSAALAGATTGVFQVGALSLLPSTFSPLFLPELEPPRAKSQDSPWTRKYESRKS